MERLPPLTALRAFEAAGRRGIDQAACYLNVTPAAINHQIRALETELGIALFTRNRGRVPELTLKGQAYLTQVAQIFDKIDKSTRAIRDERNHDRIVIDALTSFAADFLVPALPGFVAANPDMDVELLTSTKQLGPVKLETRGADVAIRCGVSAGHWEGLYVEELLTEKMFPVCAPALLRGSDAIRRPADLARHRLLAVTHTPEGWHDWLEQAAARGEDVSKVDVARAIKFDLFHLAQIAAVKGMGVDLARAPLVDRLLESGDLVAPFDLKVAARTSYWLIANHDFARTPVFAAFREWLYGEVERSKYLKPELSLAS